MLGGVGAAVSDGRGYPISLLELVDAFVVQVRGMNGNVGKFEPLNQFLHIR